MPFNYHFLENRLEKINENCSSEILNKYHAWQEIYSTNGFQLSQNEQITFEFSEQDLTWTNY